MRRRDFLGVLGGAAAAIPLAVYAQPAMPVIGFLSSASPAPWAPFVAGFRRGLNEAGFVEGQNATIEYRWAEGQYSRLPALAADLAGRGAAVILAAGGSDPARAAMAAGAAIPVVFVSNADPVKTGLVANLNRPGGTATGVSLIGSALEAKRLGFLHEIVPNASTIAVIINPNFGAAKSQSDEVQEAMIHLGLKPIVLAVGTEADIETAFATLVQQGAGAVLVTQDPFLTSKREQFFALAARYALPMMYNERESAEAGALVSYGTPVAEGFRQGGVYVAQILKGAKPADLPVVQPTKFELVINLKTARALGLDIPPNLLAIADEVVE